MWIFAKKGFFSIVEDRDDEDLLLVRSRFKGDIEALFPGADVRDTEEADYRFRAWLPRDEVAVGIAQQIRDIEYGNFKNAVDDYARHAAYTGVWAVMARAQDHRYGIPCLDDPEQYEFELWPDDEQLWLNGPENGPFYVPEGGV